MAGTDRVYLVVGVGGGLGTAVASLLAAEGATVVGVARGTKQLERIDSHARTRGWKLFAEAVDATNQAELDAMVQRVVQQHGHLDGVSINVGHWVVGESLLHKMSEEEWALGLRDNLDPLYRLGRSTLPHLIEQGHGSIVAVGAAPAVRWAGSASYHASKGGLADVIPRLARDYRPHGIRFNAVLPGSMGHDLTDLDPPAPGAPIPLTDTTATSPWEVARGIRYLLSDESRWVTGTLLVIDGGATAGVPDSG
jgi:NAD(P)-dependent dehydrogenase (short-subunit alcohol dehydrogenase family)